MVTLSRRRRMVAYIITYVTLLLAVRGTALKVLSREFVERVFRDVVDCCAAPQNPSGAIPRGGSSDGSARCPELGGEWGMRRVAVLGKSQSTKASSMMLRVLALVVRRQATSDQVHLLVKHHCTNGLRRCHDSWLNYC